jgi:[FeFe] hydrogenase H-cluster maturation GTPase HydF
MKNFPKSLRAHIGIFGRTNAGKSSFLNLITSQDISIVSAKPGTTTDAVEKTMEFGPVGPVVFIDTAGVDDDSELSGDRVKRTAAVFDRADVFVVITEPGRFGEYEERLCGAAKERGAPVVVVVNKVDLCPLTDEFREKLGAATPHVMACSCVADSGGGERGDGTLLGKPARESVIRTFEQLIISALGGAPPQPKTLIADLIPEGGLAVLVVPIDTGAPKGRLILPQAHAVRDLLDGGCVAAVVRDTELEATFSMLVNKPDIVVCDSQVVEKVAALTPKDVPCTTFSILFARLKGDIAEAERGADAIGKLKVGDKVLIAEACTHHAGTDDIGRVKIPRMLRQRVGADLQIDVCSGRDYPQDLNDYALIIHCGACMLTGREMSARIAEAVKKGVPITNYGMAISYFKGVLERVMEPLKSKSFKVF